MHRGGGDPSEGFDMIPSSPLPFCLLSASKFPSVDRSSMLPICAPTPPSFFLGSGGEGADEGHVEKKKSANVGASNKGPLSRPFTSDKKPLVDGPFLALFEIHRLKRFFVRRVRVNPGLPSSGSLFSSAGFLISHISASLPACLRVLL